MCVVRENYPGVNLMRPCVDTDMPWRLFGEGKIGQLAKRVYLSPCHFIENPVFRRSYLNMVTSHALCNGR